MPGDYTRPDPAVRGKCTAKRCVLADGKINFLRVLVAGANVHEYLLLERTSDEAVVGRLVPDEARQHLWMDKGGHTPTGESAAWAAGYGY